MKAKNAQEVRSKHKEGWGLYLFGLLIIIAAIVYFVMVNPAQAIKEVVDSCWTYPPIQDEYVGPSLSVGEAANREKTNIRDGCGNDYRVIMLPEDESYCCQAGAPVVPLVWRALESGLWGTKIILWWCAESGWRNGLINGQLIFFDTDAYVGFLPDPTCYEP